MKKNKQENSELVKDDEVLRMQGVEDGKKGVHKWAFRPITALTISWIQRNRVFAEDNDMIWKVSAYAFLHTAAYSEIRRVVNDKDAFVDAVDVWIEKNIVHHDEIKAISEEMNSAFSRYSSSIFTSGDGSGNSSGN
jgi:hypothetical protein